MPTMLSRLGLRVMIAILALSPFLFSGTPATAALSDPLNNSSFETQGETLQIAYDWQDFGVGYKRVTRSHSGIWGIKLQTRNYDELAGAYQRIDLQQTEQKPVFIGAYVKGLGINMQQGSWLGASIYAEIHLQDGTVVYWNSVPNYGSFNWRQIGFNTATVAAINQPIDHIFVIPLLGNARGAAWFDDITVTEYDTHGGGAVTIMFDDGEDNTYTAAKPILDAHNFKGVSAIISDKINEPGFMTADQIKELANTGWEIVSHSVSHEDMTQMTSVAARLEFRRSQSALSRIGIQTTNFAYPFGAYNSELIDLGSNYYTSMRAYEQGDNAYGTFPYDVKVRGMLNTTTAEDITTMLAHTATNNEWTVLVFHTIADSSDDSYYTTEADLTNIIDAIAASGLPVLTYQQGLDQFGIK